MKLEKHIKTAIKCGPIPKIRDIDNLPYEELTRGEAIVRFAHDLLVVPEGLKTGQPLRLEPFQIAFILAVFDNPHQTRRAIMSIARRNGKTFLVAVILLAYILGPEAILNATYSSSAQSRDQAALVFNLMNKMLMMSPGLNGLYRVVPSSKRIVGLSKNTEYVALSSDAKTGHGKSLAVVLLDEAGQIRGPSSDYVDMLISSQGSYKAPLMLTISTQAADNNDLLSTWIDDAIINQDVRTVCHLYEVPEDVDMMDESKWIYANPGLGVFRSLEDMRQQAESAERIPAQQAGFRNLLLNQRISLESIWLAPSIWKENGAAYDMEVFREKGVSIGLDLSRINDLCCAVISAMDDDGEVHVRCYTFSPLYGIVERANRDRNPYPLWVEQGHIYAPPGKTLDYDMVAGWLKIELERENISVNGIYFDRWAAKEFFAACDRVGFAQNATREEVGQGFQSISPRVTAMETALLQGRIRHGGNQPVLNLGASSAIVVADPGNNRKLDKSRSANKIDGIMAMLMSVYPHIAQVENVVDVDSWIV